MDGNAYAAPPLTAVMDETEACAGARSARAPLLLASVAVGKTPGEHAGSLVRGSSENGHLVRRTQPVRCEDVVHGGSEVHLRKRAARFLERLYPTATSKCSTASLGCFSSSIAAAGRHRQPLPLAGLRLDHERVAGSPRALDLVATCRE
jgi:hypothetical protein